MLDSVNYDIFINTDTPVMDSIGEVHKAISYGQFTTPSLAAMLVGYLPRCTIPNCFHNNLFPKPFFNVIQEALRRGDVYVFTSNPFVEWLFKPQVYGLNPKYHFEYYGTRTPYTRTAVNFLSQLHSWFFAFLHVMETHDPYYDGRSFHYSRQLSKEGAIEKQKEAIHYIDGELKPLVERGYDIIITADHGELHPYGHPTEVFDKSLFEVPIISNKKGNFFE